MLSSRHSTAFSPFSIVRCQGFSLLEVLVSLVIVALGLLGLAGLQVRMQQAELESYQRNQAVIILYDIVERIQTQKASVSCFTITTDAANGTPFIGAGASAPTGCAASSAANNTLADNALAELDGLLDGASEKSGGNSIGAIEGARACISYGGSSTEVIGASGSALPGTGVYTVVVSWQGRSDSAPPTVNCANDQYGSSTKRRAVSATFRLAALS